MTDTERLAALLKKTMPNVGTYNTPIYWQNAARALVAAGVRVEERCDPPCGDCCREHPHWSHWHASDIDPDRLARVIDGPVDKALGWSLSAALSSIGVGPQAIAAAIVKAYEEEG